MKYKQQITYNNYMNNLRPEIDANRISQFYLNANTNDFAVEWLLENPTQYNLFSVNTNDLAVNHLITNKKIHWWRFVTNSNDMAVEFLLSKENRV